MSPLWHGIATKLAKRCEILMLEMKYFEIMTKNILSVSMFWLIQAILTYLFFNFCNGYSKNKNHQKGWSVDFQKLPIKERNFRKIYLTQS